MGSSCFHHTPTYRRVRGEVNSVCQDSRTSFWVDPEEDLVGVFMVQIRPNRNITFRDQFKRLVYQALIG